MTGRVIGGDDGASERRGARQTGTADRLQRWLATFYAGESIVVLANREPLRHDRTADGDIVVSRSAVVS